MQHLWKIAAAENSFLASSWEKVDFPSFFISPAFQAADRSSRLELRRVSTFLLELYACVNLFTFP